MTSRIITQLICWTRSHQMGYVMEHDLWSELSRIMQSMRRLLVVSMLERGCSYLGSLCRPRRTSHFLSNWRENSSPSAWVLPWQLTRHRVRPSQMSAFTFPSQYSHMGSYMLHCQEECRERRHGFWPSQTRMLINPGKAPRTLSTEMFWRDEAGALFHYFFHLLCSLSKPAYGTSSLQAYQLV